MKRHHPVNRTQLPLEPHSLTAILPIIILRQKNGLVFSVVAAWRHQHDGANSKVETRRKLHDVLSQVLFPCACLLLKSKWFHNHYTCMYNVASCRFWQCHRYLIVPEDYRFTNQYLPSWFHHVPHLAAIIEVQSNL